MQKLLDLLQRVIAGILRWSIDHLPMPSGLREGLRAKQDTLGEIVRFGFAGIGATVTFWPIYLFLLLPMFRGEITTGWAYLLANIPAVIVAYLISARFVFDRGEGGNRRFEIVMFFVLNAAAIAFAYFALSVCEAAFAQPVRVCNRAGACQIVERLPLWLELVVPNVAILASWVIRFVVARRFIFKTHLERPAFDMVSELAHLDEEQREQQPPAAGSAPGA